MKCIGLLLTGFILPIALFAQRTVQLRNLWARPQVHVLFGDYTVSFTIKDINKALTLLSQTGDHTFATSCNLDTGGNYIIELYPGLRMEYHNSLEPILQKGVGAYLLLCGHAVVQNRKHKKLKAVVSDIQPLIEGVDLTDIKFYDPKTNKLLFSGNMAADMYYKDIGID
jgi:hypothetical protein